MTRMARYAVGPQLRTGELSCAADLIALFEMQASEEVVSPKTIPVDAVSRTRILLHQRAISCATARDHLINPDQRSKTAGSFWAPGHRFLPPVRSSNARRTPFCEECRR